MGLFGDGFKVLKKASEPLYKTPKSIQETIEIMAVAENGIFEVAKNRYSKCYRFRILTTPLPRKMNRLAFSKDTASS